MPEEAKIKISLDGNKYPLVLPDDFTMQDHFDFEDIAKESAVAIDRLDREFRFRVVIAWMAVSIRTSKPQTNIEQILTRLLELKAADVMEAWKEITAQAGQSPPAENSDSGSEMPTETTSSESMGTFQEEDLPGTGSRSSAVTPSGQVTSAS